MLEVLWQGFNLNASWEEGGHGSPSTPHPLPHSPKLLPHLPRPLAPRVELVVPVLPGQLEVRPVLYETGQTGFEVVVGSAGLGLGNYFTSETEQRVDFRLFRCQLRTEILWRGKRGRKRKRRVLQ